MIDDSSRSLADVLRPPAQQDEFTAWMNTPDQGFIGAKKLPDGTYAGITRLAFTYGLCLGVTPTDFCERRYCFPDLVDALHAFDKLTSLNDEPVGWIASRPKPVEEDYRPISTAPLDGTIIRAASFEFGHCNYCRTAAYEDGWMEVDSSRAGQQLQPQPTHWKP